MTIAASVQNHLVREGVSYELIEHARTLDSAHTAQAAHVPGPLVFPSTFVVKHDASAIESILSKLTAPILIDAVICEPHEA